MKGSTMESISQQAANLRESWETDQRWAGVTRDYSAQDVIRLRGGPSSAVLRSTSVVVRAPGLPPAGLQFSAAGPWRQDLDQFVAEMQTAGFRVGGYTERPTR